MNIITAIGSKKLMLAGVVLALIVRDAESRVIGWQWWHAISIAIVTFGYCIAQGLSDGLLGHGVEAQEARIEETKPK